MSYQNTWRKKYVQRDTQLYGCAIIEKFNLVDYFCTSKYWFYRKPYSECTIEERKAGDGVSLAYGL